MSVILRFDLYQTRFPWAVSVPLKVGTCNLPSRTLTRILSAEIEALGTIKDDLRSQVYLSISLSIGESTSRVRHRDDVAHIYGAEVLVDIKKS